MKVSIILLSVFAASAFASPLGQLFNPFGDFLQGNIFNPKGKGNGFADFYNLFEETLENDEYLERLFNDFKEKFHKKYTNEENVKRISLFKKSLLSVFKHNLDANNGKYSFTMHINQFSDMELEEIIKNVAGYFPSHQYGEKVFNHTKIDVNQDSWSFDYRTKNDVGPVQNQGSCGSCVFFAAAACVESSWAFRGHGITPLSTQQLVDCATDDRGNHGCAGGTFVPTFDYIVKHGLTSWQNYPYIAKDAQCQKNKEAQPVAHISKWHPVEPHGNEDVLQKTIEAHGPVAVAIHVSNEWAAYKQGIFDMPCAGGRNHGVLAVGYGYDHDSNKDYWIVKNQWGTGFGENGFIRMRRNNGNMCDISGDAVWVE